MIRFPISDPLFEAVDGLLVVCFIAMTAFALMHLYRTWHGIRMVTNGKFRFKTAVLIMYYDNKPGIAHTVFVFSLCLRFAILWHVRHTHDHQLVEDFITRDAAIWYLLSNLLLVTSAICWCRNVSPIVIKNWIWVLAIAAALIGSTWLAQ